MHRKYRSFLSPSPVFQGKDSLNQCLKAYEDIINAREKQVKEINARVNKYSPDRIK